MAFSLPNGPIGPIVKGIFLNRIGVPPLPFADRLTIPNNNFTHACMQVIMVVSEKATGGFLAPSITILPRDGWKGGATVEKCKRGAQN